MKWLKWFAFPVILLLAHSGLVALIFHGVRSSNDPEAAMGWILFAVIDWPASSPFFPALNDGLNFVMGIAILGGLQWFIIGLSLQRIVEWGLRRIRSGPRSPAQDCPITNWGRRQSVPRAGSWPFWLALRGYARFLPGAGNVPLSFGIEDRLHSEE
jgi:hypothetical protein